MDKGNTENYNYGSDDSGDTDNNDAGDGDSSNSDSSNSNSSDSDEGNKAYGYVGQRGLLVPISYRLKLKRAIKYYL